MAPFQDIFTFFTFHLLHVNVNGCLKILLCIFIVPIGSDYICMHIMHYVTYTEDNFGLNHIKEALYDVIQTTDFAARLRGHECPKKILTEFPETLI